jgi:Short C-terminal domain
MGFFKDIRDVSKQGKELGDYHGGMPTWKQAMSDFRGVADDRGQGEVLSKGTPSSAVVKGPPMPIEGDRFAMQILLDVTPPGGGAAYEVNYVFPAARMKAGLMPGQTVPIKVMPDDPQRIAVHWDAQKANIAAAGGDMAAAMQGMQNMYDGTADAAMRRATAERAGPPSGPIPTPDPAGPGATRAAAGGDVTARLAKLNELRQQGLVTEAEFEAKKAALLKEL